MVRIINKRAYASSVSEPCEATSSRTVTTNSRVNNKHHSSKA